MKRRDVLKGLTLLPLGASGFPMSSLSAAPAVSGKGPLLPGPQLFQSIGVEPLINCMGTFTIIGGSLERQSVRAAMEAASRNFVQYDELAAGIGRRMAELTGAEWGMVSAGCAAGLKHVTAACVTGGDPEKLIRIPDLTGFEKTEVVIPTSSRNVYDHAVRNVGVTVINAGTMEELEKALGPKTAMIYLKANSKEPFTVENIARLATPKNIPLLVDAAAEDLTIPSVHLVKGAAIVAYSGGKAMCGPQCSGILLGKKSILQSAWQASSPHHGPGRDNKVGREEMIGALAAIEAWVTFDHKGQWKKWLSYLDTTAKRLSGLSGVKTKVQEPPGISNNSPVLIISWDPLQFNITGEEMAETLGRSKPRIALAFGTPWGVSGELGMTSVYITAGQMQPGEDKVVAERLYSELARKRDPKPTEMKAPSSVISGRWEATVDFYSSSSKYVWTLEQDGNWIKGMHTGTFSASDIHGTLEGEEIRLRCSANTPGDRLAYSFTGKVLGDTMKGAVYLVEYGTATFSAIRVGYKQDHSPVQIPGGDYLPM